LRRLELDACRRDLADVAWRQEELNEKMENAWRGLPEVAGKDTMQVRGQLIVATRIYASSLRTNLIALDTKRHHLEDRVREKLLQCRQSETAIEQWAIKELRSKMKKEETEAHDVTTARFTSAS
jgi:hypothetical protein